MRVAFLFMFLLVGGFPLHAAGIEKPAGKNCNLLSPPATAGEEINHGITLRVYPRAKDIDTRYSGCQVLFAPEGEKWIALSLTEVVKGYPVRIWSAYETNADVRACRFRQGKLVQGNPDTCPAPELILMKSLAASCVRTVQDAVAKHGLGAPWPPECEYD